MIETIAAAAATAWIAYSSPICAASVAELWQAHALDRKVQHQGAAFGEVTETTTFVVRWDDGREQRVRLERVDGRACLTGYVPLRS